MIRKPFFVILSLALLPFAAAAQSRDHYGQGYAFVAPSGLSERGGALHFGVGGEALVYKGLGVGAEAGYGRFIDEDRNGFGVVSGNVSYHFTNVSSSGKFAPFITGGYSLLFSRDFAHAGNFGAGINWWFKEHLGLRVEFRDHVIANSDARHFFGIRFGLAFR